MIYKELVMKREKMMRTKMRKLAKSNVGLMERFVKTGKTHVKRKMHGNSYSVWC
jgi:hypothetical protein